MKDWLRSPEPEGMMGPSSLSHKRSRRDRSDSASSSSSSSSAAAAEAGPSRIIEEKPVIVTNNVVVARKADYGLVTTKPQRKAVKLADDEDHGDYGASLLAAEEGLSKNQDGHPFRRSMIHAQSTFGRDPTTRPKRQLKTLSDMCFRATLTHLTSLTDPSDLDSLIPFVTSLNHPCYSDPLLKAIETQISHLERLQRAKEAALKSREEEREKRRSSVVLGATTGQTISRANKVSRFGGFPTTAMPISGAGGAASAAARGRIVPDSKSKGGKKMWASAQKAAASANGRR